MTDSEIKPNPSKEPEFPGPIWKHPYFLYVVLTVLLFLFLMVAGGLALRNGWVPSRGI